MKKIKIYQDYVNEGIRDMMTPKNSEEIRKGFEKIPIDKLVKMIIDFESRAFIEDEGVRVLVFEDREEEIKEYLLTLSPFVLHNALSEYDEDGNYLIPDDYREELEEISEEKIAKAEKELDDLIDLHSHELMKLLVDLKLWMTKYGGDFSGKYEDDVQKAIKTLGGLIMTLGDNGGGPTTARIFMDNVYVAYSKLMREMTICSVIYNNVYYG